MFPWPGGRGLRGERGLTKKKTLPLPWKISLPSGGIQELKNVYAWRNKTDQQDFSGSEKPN